MPGTYREAVDDMLGVFKAAWDTTGLTALYPGIDGSPPADFPVDLPGWARVTLRHTDGRQVGHGEQGQQRFERHGLLIIQIFVSPGRGYGPAYDLAKVVTDAYQGATTSKGVWFRGHHPREVPSDGAWLQLNVHVEFEYDEIT